jgi:hypothetical protein
MQIGLVNKIENEADLALMMGFGVSETQRDEIEARMGQRGMTLDIQLAVADIRLQMEQVKDTNGNVQVVMNGRSKQRYDAAVAKAQAARKRNDELEQRMKSRGMTVEMQAAVADTRRETEQEKDANGNVIRVVLEAESQKRHDAVVARARAEGRPDLVAQVGNQADLALMTARGITLGQQDEIEARMVQRGMTVELQAAVANIRHQTEPDRDSNGNPINILMDAKSKERHDAVVARAGAEGKLDLVRHMENQISP